MTKRKFILSLITINVFLLSVSLVVFYFGSKAIDLPTGNVAGANDFSRNSQRPGSLLVLGEDSQQKLLLLNQKDNTVELLEYEPLYSTKYTRLLITELSNPSLPLHAQFKVDDKSNFYYIDQVLDKDVLVKYQKPGGRQEIYSTSRKIKSIYLQEDMIQILSRDISEGETTYRLFNLDKNFSASQIARFSSTENLYIFAVGKNFTYISSRSTEGCLELDKLSGVSKTVNCYELDALARLDSQEIQKYVVVRNGEIQDSKIDGGSTWQVNPSEIPTSYPLLDFKSEIYKYQEFIDYKAAIAKKTTGIALPEKPKPIYVSSFNYNLEILGERSNELYILEADSISNIRSIVKIESGQVTKTNLPLVAKMEYQGFAVNQNYLVFRSVTHKDLPSSQEFVIFNLNDKFLGKLDLPQCGLIESVCDFKTL